MSNGCILFSVSILNYGGKIIFRVGSVFVAKLAQSSHGAKYQHHALPKVSPLRDAYLLFFMLPISFPMDATTRFVAATKPNS